MAAFVRTENRFLLPALVLVWTRTMRFFSTTYEIDQAHGTNYHENFKKFLNDVQLKDLVVDGAMTDPKGDRSLSPQQTA